MTAYYIKSGGSDLADGQSWDNAWATFNQAFGTAGAGDTVTVRDGTFGENMAGTHYAYINSVAPASVIAYSAETVGSKAVILQGDGTAGTAYATRFRLSGKLSFTDIAFGPPVAAGTKGAIYINNGSDTLTFTDCTINGSTLTHGVNVDGTVGAALSALTFDGCTITAPAATRYGFLCANGTAAGVDGITLTDCNVSGNYALYIAGATNVHISGGSYTASQAYGLCIGIDADGGTTTHVTGYVRNVLAMSPDHTVLIGSDTTNVELSGSKARGTTYLAFCDKGEGSIVTGNQFLSPCSNAGPCVLFKGATGPTFTKNVVYSLAGSCISASLQTARKVSDPTINGDNFIYAGPNAVCFNWDTATNVSGTESIDGNHYFGPIGTNLPSVGIGANSSQSPCLHLMQEMMNAA